MRCTACDRENRDDASFCARCGTSLAPSCAAWGRELASDSRLCDGCGIPLADDAPTVDLHGAHVVKAVGDRLILLEGEGRTSTWGVGRGLLLYRSNDEGLLDYVAMFDPEDRGEALAELVRLHDDGRGSA